MNKLIRRSISLFYISFVLSLNISAQENIPEGFHLLYQQDFSSAEAINQFEMTDPSAWKAVTGEEGYLELFGKSNYESRVRSPFNIALLKEYMFGDFVLEANLSQSGREYGHRDLRLFFGAKDATNFYYVHIASVADPNANNIFLVNDAPRTNIAIKTTDGTNWGATNSWHKVRIERNISEGDIKIYFEPTCTLISGSKRDFAVVFRTIFLPVPGRT